MKGKLFPLIAALVMGVGITPLNAQPACRQALALGLDISGSVDDQEYQLQQQGLAAALLNESVQGALLLMSDRPVNLLVYEWSAAEYQQTIVGWTAIDSADTLQKFATALVAHPRGAAPYPTSIGSAMLFAAAAFQQVPNCTRKTLDLSGDGKSNSWPPPERIRLRPEFRDITVNALVIGEAAPIGNNVDHTLLEDLVSYFEAQVIHGPNAFVEAANGFENYEAAMVRKLLRELEGPQLMQWTPLNPDRPSVNVANLIGPIPFDPPQ